MMYCSILVPLDGSPLGEHVLPVACGIARRCAATLQLVHVHTVTVSPSMDGERAIDSTHDAQCRAREWDYLNDLAQRLAAAEEISVTAKLIEGALIADALHDHAIAIGADLVVMTTHGRGLLSRAWLGSVADAFVRRAPLPVLLVRPDAGEPPLAVEPVFRHVLVPLDGSTLAEQILPFATALSVPAETTYTLLQVVEPVVLGYAPYAYAVGLDQRVLDQTREAARAYLESIAEGLRAQGAQVRTVVVVGAPALGILDYVSDHRADLIALETHGRGGLARLLLGSVADKVVRGAHTPVLLHRPAGTAH
jgi:nucleotide-binding universal stress UspA family protein